VWQWRLSLWIAHWLRRACADSSAYTCSNASTYASADTGTNTGTDPSANAGADPGTYASAHSHADAWLPGERKRHR
jgi:hypothetical protein